MNSPLSWFCLFSLFVPTVIGVALALALHPRLGGWAHLVGYALPPVGLVALYALYFAIVRANPCEPAGSLACGERAGYLLVIFLAFMAITIVVGAVAQLVVFFILRARRRAPLTVLPSNPRG
jgi:hypothetical protein